MKTGRVAAVLCLLFTMSALQAPALSGDDRIEREGKLSRLQKKIAALRAWQLTEELDLDAETSSRLFPAMKRADEERWRIESRNRLLVRELSRALGKRDPDQAEIDRILDEMISNRKKLAQAEERHIKRVRELLSPEDTARYILFQIRFQKEIKQKAAQALRDRRLQEDTDPEGRGNYGGRGFDGGDSSGGNDSRR